METKRLHELMPLTGQAQQWADVCVYGVSSDSRQVKQGDLFITCLGEPKRLRCYVTVSYTHLTLPTTPYV